MKIVTLVLVLTLGGCASAFAGTCSVSASSTASSCSSSVDGTTFTVSLISLTNASLTNTVNVNVNGYNTIAGTDVFSVQVLGGNPFTSKIGVNYDVSVSGNPGASVTSVSTTLDGRVSGAALSTEVSPSGSSSLGEWSLTSSLMKDATGSHSTPSFVSAEVNNDLNLPSGLSLSGFTETFTVIWTADLSSNPSFRPAGDPIVPEPASIGLVAFAGLVGAFFARRRSLKR